MSAFLTATGAVALAEIGDKTQLLSFMLAARFRLAVGRLGLGGARVVSQALDCSQFAPPPEAPAQAPGRQLELL